MKKFTAFLMSTLMAFMLFAQANSESVPSVGIKDSDVKSFIKNFDKIEKDFEKLSIQMDASTSVSQGEVANAEKILEKNGISGPNSILKFQAIAYASAYYVTEVTLGEKYAKMVGGTYLQLVNEKDMAIIGKNKKELVKLYGDVEEISDEEKEDLENALDMFSGSFSDALKKKFK